MSEEKSRIDREIKLIKENAFLKQLLQEKEAHWMSEATKQMTEANLAKNKADALKQKNEELKEEMRGDLLYNKWKLSESRTAKAIKALKELKDLGEGNCNPHWVAETANKALQEIEGEKRSSKI